MSGRAAWLRPWAVPAALAGCALAGTARGGPFVFETVEDAGSYQSVVSLAFSGSNEAAVAYNRVDPVWSALYFASRTAGVWSVEVVDSTPASGWSPSLAFDPGGQPWIAYGDPPYVKVAHPSPRGWIKEIAEYLPGGYDFTTSYHSLVFDAAGTPHLAYHYTEAEILGVDEVHYATKVGSLWTVEVVDEGNSAGLFTSIALDPQGDPWIAYGTGHFLPLKLAHRKSGTWTLEVVAPGGSHTSLRVDDDGVPHLAHDTMPERDLAYTTRSGDAWVTEVVDDTGPQSWKPRLDLDSAGRPWIGYIGASGLRMARRDAGGWHLQDVDVGVPVWGPTMALDEDDRPWFGYYDGTNTEIRVARANEEALSVPLPADHALGIGLPVPNPSRGPVSLTVRAGRACALEFLVHDVAGRVVGRQELRTDPRGVGIATWDARDAAPGVYFLSLEANGQRETARFVKLR